MSTDDLPTNADWDDYDWEEILDVTTTAAGDLAGEHIEPVTAKRIALVLHWDAYSPDGYASKDFWAIVLLNDGRCAVSEAWADTSGWDCQSGSWWKVGTYDECVAELSQSNRDDLLAKATR